MEANYSVRTTRNPKPVDANGDANGLRLFLSRSPFASPFAFTDPVRMNSYNEQHKACHSPIWRDTCCGIVQAWLMRSLDVHVSAAGASGKPLPMRIARANKRRAARILDRAGSTIGVGVGSGSGSKSCCPCECVSLFCEV